MPKRYHHVCWDRVIAYFYLAIDSAAGSGSVLEIFWSVKRNTASPGSSKNLCRVQMSCSFSGTVITES